MSVIYPWFPVSTYVVLHPISFLEKKTQTNPFILTPGKQLKENN